MLLRQNTGIESFVVRIDIGTENRPRTGIWVEEPCSVVPITMEEIRDEKWLRLCDSALRQTRSPPAWQASTM